MEVITDNIYKETIANVSKICERYSKDELDSIIYEITHVQNIDEIASNIKIDILNNSLYSFVIDCRLKFEIKEITQVYKKINEIWEFISYNDFKLFISNRTDQLLVFKFITFNTNTKNYYSGMISFKLD